MLLYSSLEASSVIIIPFFVFCIYELHEFFVQNIQNHVQYLMSVYSHAYARGTSVSCNKGFFIQFNLKTFIPARGRVTGDKSIITKAT